MPTHVESAKTYLHAAIEATKEGLYHLAVAYLDAATDELTLEVDILLREEERQICSSNT